MDRTWCVTRSSTISMRLKARKKFHPPPRDCPHPPDGGGDPGGLATSSIPKRRVLIGEIFRRRRLSSRPHLRDAPRQAARQDGPREQAGSCDDDGASGALFSWAAAIRHAVAGPLHGRRLRRFRRDGAWRPRLPSRIGAKSFPVATQREFCVLSGRHLANYREEHFVKMLVPTARGLEDIFLAALSTATPACPRREREAARRPDREGDRAHPRAAGRRSPPRRVPPLRGGGWSRTSSAGRRPAIAPCLRGLPRTTRAAHKYFSRSKKATLRERTCRRLRCTQRFLGTPRNRGGGSPHATAPRHNLNEQMDDLMSFVVSDRYAEASKQIGIAIPTSNGG